RVRAVVRPLRLPPARRLRRTAALRPPSPPARVRRTRHTSPDHRAESVMHGRAGDLLFAFRQLVLEDAFRDGGGLHRCVLLLRVVSLRLLLSLTARLPLASLRVLRAR